MEEERIGRGCFGKFFASLKRKREERDSSIPLLAERALYLERGYN